MLKNINKFVAKLLLVALVFSTIFTSNVLAEELVEIEWWYAFGGSVQENNDALVKQFNETVGKEEGIHVSASSQGDYTDIFTKLQAGFVAGEVPHVSVVNSLSIVNFGKNGMLEPLEDYVNPEAMEDFYPGLLLNSYYEGVQYGLPFLRSTPLMYYNATLLEEAGIEPKVETFDEMVEVARQLKEFGVEGLGIVADQWHFDGLLRQSGSGWLNDDLTEAIFASEEAVQFFEKMKQLQEEGVIKFYNSGDELATARANQQLGMWFASTGSLTNLLQVAEDQGFEIDTAYIPTTTGDRNVPTGGANIAMIAGHSDEEKEAAAVFMNWLTDTDQVVHSHIHTGYLPTRKSVATDSRIEELYNEIPQYQTALNQLEYAGIEPNIPGYLEIIVMVQEMMTEIFITDANVAETLQINEDAANQIIKDNQ